MVAAEMHTNKGRHDLVITHKGVTWVVEIKEACEGKSVDQKAEEAKKQLFLYQSINVSLSERKQIIDNHYAAPYPDAICLGLGIDNELRHKKLYQSMPF